MPARCRAPRRVRSDARGRADDRAHAAKDTAPAPHPPRGDRIPAVPAILHAAPGEVGCKGAHRAAPRSAERVDNRAARGVKSPGRWGRLVHLRGYGAIDWAPGSPAVTDSTLFDLASITKVVATTTAAAMLEERGRLDLDQRLAWYLPGITDTVKQRITVRQVLTHRGGFEAFAPLYREFRSGEQYCGSAARPLRYRRCGRRSTATGTWCWRGCCGAPHREELDR